MQLTDLTELWVEAPFISDALKHIPDHVNITISDPASQPPPPGAPYQAIIASSLLQYDGALMDTLPNLRIIARTGIGYDNVNLPDATAHGIVATNTPDGPTESTAEHTVAMMLSLAKRIKQGDANVAAGKWGPRAGTLIGIELKDKTLGLVGLGRIGKRVANICRLGLEMKVLAYDPYVSAEQGAALGVEMTDLDGVIRGADVISVHVPATPETHHLVNRESIAKMKDGVIVLNLARGPLVDEDALLEAVDSGKVLGAGIDVYDPEPPATDSRLRNHPLIIATPHTAGLTLEGRERTEVMAVERVLAFFRGETPPDVLNRDVLQ